MRLVDPGLQQHLESGATTVCTCWILIREDGLVLGFTDHDRDLEIGGVVCSAASGFQPTEAASQIGLAVDDQEIEGALDSIFLKEEEILSGLFDRARVETWTVNWQHPAERLHLRTSILGEIGQRDGVFRAELRGLTSLLDRDVGRTFVRHCDALLGDERCGVDVSDPQYGFQGSVDEVVGRRFFRCNDLTAHPLNWFAGGTLTWLSGANAGLTKDINGSGSSAREDIHLLGAMPFPVVEGDTFRLTAGCDKTFETCKVKFGNTINFQGCPHIPGSDFALGFADRDTVHDGGPLFE